MAIRLTPEERLALMMGQFNQQNFVPSYQDPFAGLAPTNLRTSPSAGLERAVQAIMNSSGPDVEYYQQERQSPGYSAASAPILPNQPMDDFLRPNRTAAATSPLQQQPTMQGENWDKLWRMEQRLDPPLQTKVERANASLNPKSQPTFDPVQDIEQDQPAKSDGGFDWGGKWKQVFETGLNAMEKMQHTPFGPMAQMVKQALPMLQQVRDPVTAAEAQRKQALEYERDRQKRIQKLVDDPDAFAGAIIGHQILPEDLAQIPAHKIPFDRIAKSSLPSVIPADVTAAMREMGTVGLQDPEAGKAKILEVLGGNQENKSLQFMRGFGEGATESVTLGAKQGIVPPQSGIETFGQTAGAVVGQLPWIYAAGATGGALAGNLAGRAGLSPAIQAIAQAAGTGGTIQGGREAVQLAQQGREYDWRGAPGRIGESALEYGAFQAVAPFTEPVAEAVFSPLRKGGRALENLAIKRGNLPAYNALQAVKPVARGAVEAAEATLGGFLSGTAVGLYKTAAEEAGYGDGFSDAKRFVMSVLQNGGQEASEEIVEAIAYALVRKYIGPNAQAILESARQKRIVMTQEAMNAWEQGQQESLTRRSDSGEQVFNQPTEQVVPPPRVLAQQPPQTVQFETAQPFSGTTAGGVDSFMQTPALPTPEPTPEISAPEPTQEDVPWQNQDLTGQKVTVPGKTGPYEVVGGTDSVVLVREADDPTKKPFPVGRNRIQPYEEPAQQAEAEPTPTGPVQQPEGKTIDEEMAEQPDVYEAGRFVTEIMGVAKAVQDNKTGNWTFTYEDGTTETMTDADFNRVFDENVTRREQGLPPLRPQAKEAPQETPPAAESSREEPTPVQPKQQDSVDKGQEVNQDAANGMGSNGTGPLEGTPTEDVQGTGADRQAESGPAGSGRPDQRPVHSPDSGRNEQPRGMGDGQGAVPTPADGGSRAGAGNGPEPVGTTGGAGRVAVTGTADIKGALTKNEAGRYVVADGVNEIFIRDDAQVSQVAIDRLLDAVLRGDFTKEDTADGVIWRRPGTSANQQQQTPPQQTTPPTPATTSQGSSSTQQSNQGQPTGPSDFAVGDWVTYQRSNGQTHTGQINSFKPMMGGWQAVFTDQNGNEWQTRTEQLTKAEPPQQTTPPTPATGQGSSSAETPTGPITKGREMGPPAVGSSGQTVYVEFHKQWGKTPAGRVVTGVIQKVYKNRGKDGNWYTNADIRDSDGRMWTVPVNAKYTRIYAGTTTSANQPEQQPTPRPQPTPKPQEKPPQPQEKPKPKLQSAERFMLDGDHSMRLLVTDGKLRDGVKYVLWPESMEATEEAATQFVDALIAAGLAPVEIKGSGIVFTSENLTDEQKHIYGEMMQMRNQTGAASDDPAVSRMSDDDDWGEDGPTVAAGSLMKGSKAVMALYAARKRIDDERKADAAKAQAKVEEEQRKQKEAAEAQRKQKEAEEAERKRQEEEAKREAEEKRKAELEAALAGTRNYVITGNEGIGAGTPLAKAKGQVEAIRTLLQLEMDGRAPSPTEQQTLAKFVGWGTISKAVDDRYAPDYRYAKPHDYDEWMPIYRELKLMLSPEEFQKAKDATVNAQYTDIPVVQAIWGALESAGFTGGRVLEPATGSGNFLGTVPASARDNTHLMGVELDSLTSRIVKMLYPQANIHTNTGFEDVQYPDNFFDLIISNVPFSNTTKPVDKRYDHLKPSLHNYFFLKAMDKVRPGGIVAFITSRFTMDAQDPSIRAELSRKGDLVAAVRLPNSAFKGNANTDVTTDLIILRKREDGDRPNGVKWTEMGRYVRVVTEEKRKGRIIYTETNDFETEGPNINGIPINEYFVKNPSHILGRLADDGTMQNRYNRDGLLNPPESTVHADGRNLQEALSQVLTKLPQDLIQPPKDRTTTEALLDQLFPAPTNLIEGNYYVDDDGKVKQKREGIGVPVEDEAQAERLRGIVKIRMAVMGALRTYADPRSTDEQIAQAQKELNAAYDTHVKKYGLLRDLDNMKAMVEDPSHHILITLETDYKQERKGKKLLPGTAKKAAIFTKRTVNPINQPMNIENANDALVYALASTGKIDTGRMETLLNKPWPVIVQELNQDIARVYEDPQGGWVSIDEYLSGDVREKLRQAQKAAAKDPARFEPNVKALEAVQPTWLTMGVLSKHIQLTSPLLRQEDMHAFIVHLLGNVDNDDVTLTRVDGKEGGGITWRLIVTDWATRSRGNANWGTSEISALEILGKYALRNKRAIVYDYIPGPNGKDIRVVNEDKTLLARQKQDEIEAEMQRWLSNPRTAEEQQRSDDLETLYNNRFNSTVLRKYDGSHLQPVLKDAEGNVIRNEDGTPAVRTLPGANPSMVLRPHQLRAVWRAIVHKIAMFAHAVGAGKSLEMAATIMEGKRLGKWNKPMMVVPNHMVGDAAKQFQTLYPAARLLVGQTGMDAAYRKMFIGQIATGQWDAVIIPESFMERIPMSGEFIGRFYQKQLDALEAQLEQHKREAGKNAPTVKQLTNARNKLRTKMNRKLKQAKDRIGLTFEQLGVDAIVVDEAHEFKNLMYSTTRDNNIKGFGDKDGNDKTFDLWMKTSYMHEISGAIVFATGTPVANSMAEMYHMMRYLIPHRLEQLGLTSFDAWASAFGKVVQSLEQQPDGSFDFVDRFKKFINLPEILSLFREFADVITLPELAKKFREDPHVDYPMMWNHATGKEERTAIIVPMSDAVRRYNLTIKARIDRLKKGGVDKSTDNKLWILQDARKAAVDIRLVDPKAKDEPDSKVNYAVRELVKRFNDHAETKGTQVVFMDIGTPKKKKEGAAKLKPDQETGLNIAVPRLVEYLTADTPPKDMAPLTDVLTVLEAHGFPKTFTPDGLLEDVKAGITEVQKLPINAQTVKAYLTGIMLAEREDQDAVVLYQDMRKKLVEQGVPNDQIAFIHDYPTDAMKMDLFRKVNAGDIRILIGSTRKMGVGMNVQERLVAIHHMDPPWRPADIEQREGRGIRQGNRNAKVEVLAYTVEDSMDVASWDLLGAKADFIAQALSGTLDPTIREMEEVDELALGFQAISATSMSDKRFLKLINLGREIRTLESLERGHRLDIEQKQHDLARVAGTKSYLEKALPGMEKALEKRQSTTGDNFVMTVKGTEHKVRKAAAEALQAEIQAYQKKASTDEVVAATLGGFDIVIKAQKMGARPAIAIKNGKQELHWTEPSDSGPNGTLMTLERYINKGLDEEVTDLKQRMQRLEEDLTDLTAAINKPFEGAEELASKKREVAQLERELGIDKAGDFADDEDFNDTDSDMSMMEDEPTSSRMADDDNDDDEDGEPAVSHMAAPKAPQRQAPQTYTQQATVKHAQTPEPQRQRLTPLASRQIAEMLAETINSAVREGNPKGAEGVHYNPVAGTPYTPGAITVKERSYYNWGVTGHELGHALQQFIGWKPDQGEMKNLKGELKDVAANFYPAKVKGTLAVTEGFAEFFQLWVTGDQRLQKLAPQTLASFEKVLVDHPQLLAVLQKARQIADKDMGDLAWGSMVMGEELDSDVPVIGEYNQKKDAPLKYAAQRSYRFVLAAEDFDAARAEAKSLQLDKDTGKTVFADVPNTKPSLAKLLSVAGNQAAQSATTAMTAHARDKYGQFLTGGQSLTDNAQSMIDRIRQGIPAKFGFRFIKGPDGRFHTAKGLWSLWMAARMIKMRYDMGHGGKQGHKGSRPKGEGLAMTEEQAVRIIQYMQNRYGDYADLEDSAKKWSSQLSDTILGIYQSWGVIDSEKRKMIEAKSPPEYFMPSYYVTPNMVQKMFGRNDKRSFSGPKRFKSVVAPLLDPMSAAKVAVQEAYNAAYFKEALDVLEEGLTAHPDMSPFGAIIRDKERVAVHVSTNQAINAVLRAMGATHQDIDDAIKKHGGGFLTLFKEYYGLDSYRGQPVVANRHYVNGEEHQTLIRLAPDLYDSIQALRPVQIPWLLKMLRKIWNTPFRTVALLTPTTMANIGARDVFSATMQTQGKLHQYWANYASAAVTSLGLPVPNHEAMRDLYTQSGGFAGDPDKAHLPGSKFVTNSPPWLRKAGKALVWVLSRPQALSHFMEVTPRLAEYQTVAKMEIEKLEVTDSNGTKRKLSAKEAEQALWDLARGNIAALPSELQDNIRRIMIEGAYGSQNITADPGMHGSSAGWTIALQSVPFLQGSIQGTARAGRYVKDMTKRTVTAAKAGDWKTAAGTPASVALRLALTAALPALLSWAMMHDDDDDERWLNDVSEEMRDRYFFFPNKITGGYIAIPKGYEYGTVANMVERLLDQGPRRSVLHALKENLSPNVMSPLIAAVIAHRTGVDWETGTPIETLAEADTPVAEKAGPNTSGTAKALAMWNAKRTGELNKGWSPREIDNFVRTAWGAAGDLALWAGDKAGFGGPGATGWEAAGRDALKLASKPFAGKRWTEGGSRVVDQFYEDKTFSDQHKDYLIGWAKGKKQPYGNWDEETLRKVELYPAYQAAGDIITELRKSMNSKIQGKTPEERRQIMDRYTYYQRTIAGMFYGNVKPPVKPEAVGLTEADVNAFERKVRLAIGKAVVNERERKGGASDAVKWYRAKMKQAGGQ